MSSNNPSFFGGQRTDILDSSSLDFWDPYKDFSFPSPSALCSGQEKPAFAHTQINWEWHESPEAYILMVVLPGFKKEEMKVQIDDNRVLQINGKRILVKEDKNDAMHPVQRGSVKFLRRFRLPENTNMYQVKASMVDTILKIIIPKA